MYTNKHNQIKELLELANQYPSPHNGQPIRVKIVAGNKLDLYFENDRGLTATDISTLFSFVSMGVFTQHLMFAAQALGHELTYTLALPAEKELHVVGKTNKFGTCLIKWDAIDPNKLLHKALAARQTSRKKYIGDVKTDTQKQLEKIAAGHTVRLSFLNKSTAHQAIWLNQRAVFDDMFDEPVREELNHWLRYSATQKQQSADGLAYDCMELNGTLLKYIVNHHAILRAPVISSVIKQYYLRTMKDTSTVGYMLAPFQTEKDAFEVGIVIMKLWMELTLQGYYIHPFGTIMSNHQAHKDFVALADIANENRKDNYLVFIMRAGKSETPVRSLRIPTEKHLILQEMS